MLTQGVRLDDTQDSLHRKRLVSSDLAQTGPREWQVLQSREVLFKGPRRVTAIERDRIHLR